MHFASLFKKKPIYAFRSLINISLFHVFYVLLLDYSTLLKGQHNELIHESITLHNQALI